MMTLAGYSAHVIEFVVPIINILLYPFYGPGRCSWQKIKTCWDPPQITQGKQNSISVVTASKAPCFHISATFRRSQEPWTLASAPEWLCDLTWPLGSFTVSTVSGGLGGRGVVEASLEQNLPFLSSKPKCKRHMRSRHNGSPGGELSYFQRGFSIAWQLLVVSEMLPVRFWGSGGNQHWKLLNECLCGFGGGAWPVVWDYSLKTECAMMLPVEG